MTDNGEEAVAADIRPLVGHDSGNRPLWIGIGAILLLGIMLFFMLEGRRETVSAPAIRPRIADLAEAPSSLPPLFVPPEQVFVSAASPPKPLELKRNKEGVRPPQPQFPAQPVNQPPPARIVSNESTQSPPQQPIAQSRAPIDATPVIVFDQTTGDDGGIRPAAASGQASAPQSPALASRARAGRIPDRTNVVPQGTLIAAVLETALDSTQPGQTRAIVSRDVPNLSGPVLIPRGSRLYGEYRGQLEAGQRRAMVQWTRLETPDGATIAIDSPAADQLGRAGIQGKVNSQFVSRLGGALLQSVIDVGAIAAAGAVSSSGIFIPIPGAVRDATSQAIGQPPRPTLRVKQGTRISVFVARDLDFSSVVPRP